ncbi:MAG: acetyl-CoA carboxylase biotin carboxyl carrier protein [Gemmatimonadota bacterium]|nr:acetyl-CoA carboxylase biotin carboxyl carrier protein [Gemmatimonadaceae bacterium]MDQ3515816.1 acetyl-CoA carboxylase biotin carboxyl carrier protein [Gemmatimonadota bacterium]
MFDLRYVKKLVDMLDGSTVDSIEISSDKGMKIRISKAQQQAPVMHAPAIAPAPMAAVAAPVAAAEAAPAAKPEPAESLLEAKSPMVGTFYAAAEPGGKAYLAVGDRVRKGQIICIIEAMKIMNEIESEFDGTLREIVAQDAHPVEYGQVLFRIAPNG